MDDQFLLLFYRERVGRLADRLKLQAKTPEVAPGLSIKDVGDLLQSFVTEAEDDTLCHDICKSMYFCNRPKGHGGDHSEDNVLFWERDA